MGVKKVTVNKPLDWPSLNLSESVKSISVDVDKENNIQGQAVFIIDPGTGSAATRTPTVYRYNGDAAGGVTVWTPAPGKKFRLMGGVITLAGPALAAAGINNFLLQDGGTANIMVFTFYCPLAAASLSTVVIPFTIPGNGYLSAQVDNPLIIGLTSNLTAGRWELSCWGTEE